MSTDSIGTSTEPKHNINDLFLPFKLRNMDPMPRFAIVVIASDQNSEWIKKSIENKRDYAKKHEYD
ncbi:hypothetical protein HK096_010270, partial [Nowakowskiella sp. JEL0078]